MFPINWNDLFRKKDGTLTTMENVGGGGGGDVPPHSSSDAGKVLTVGEDGTLEWDVKGEGGGFYADLVRPIWVLSSASDITPRLSATAVDISLQDRYVDSAAGSDTYSLSQLLDFGLFKTVELYSYFTDAIASAINAVSLYSATGVVSSLELSDDISNYEFIAVQGMYDTEYSNSYNTTIIYRNVEFNKPYWFGMKDRNSSYSGTITFTGERAATLSTSRRVRIFGFNK